MIELPRDAEGREIPLDTKCLYLVKDGLKQNVERFTFELKDAEWSVETNIAIPAARAAAAIMANAVASFNEALVPVLRGVRREARALCKRLDPKWRRARIRALKRFRRNVETLKREGRCR